MQLRIALGGLISITFPFAVLSDPLDKSYLLTQTAAQQMVAACLEDQKKSGYSPVTVYVVDDGGHLLAAARQDNACKACVAIARDKAETAALYAVPTRVMADLSFGEKRDGVNAGLPGAAFVPGIVAFAGGLPITTGSGQTIGGIGVSGASADEDEQCAEVAIEAIAELLGEAS